MANYLKCCLLASGSSGNSIYLETNDTRILVDVGLSGKRIKERLAAIDVNPTDLHALVITHEHQDHIRGAGVLARQLNIPLFITEKTRLAAKLGKVPRTKNFEAGVGFAINGFYFQPFGIPHDAVDPVGFVISNDKHRIGLATDMGQVTRLVTQRLLGVDLLILETNHDEELLKEGHYPWSLKQRIRSSEGHLSNRQAAKALKHWLSPKLKQVFLAHLSETNNRPALAFETVSKVIKKGEHQDLHLNLARPDRVSEVILWR